MKSFRTLFDFENRVRLWTVMTIALATGLSACAGKPPARVPAPAVAIPAPAPAETAPPAQPQPPKLPPKRVAKPQPAVPEPARNSPGVSQVIGMSQDDLRTALGEPAERIDQGPSQTWIYRSATCTVEVLFFLDVTRNGYYALNRKISVPSTTPGGDPAERACYSEIQNARHR